MEQAGGDHLLIVVATAGQRVSLKRGIRVMHLCSSHIGQYLGNKPRLKEQAEGIRAQSRNPECKIRKKG